MQGGGACGKEIRHDDRGGAAGLTKLSLLPLDVTISMRPSRLHPPSHPRASLAIPVVTRASESPESLSVCLPPTARSSLLAQAVYFCERSKKRKWVSAGEDSSRAPRLLPWISPMKVVGLTVC